MNKLPLAELFNDAVELLCYCIVSDCYITNKHFTPLELYMVKTILIDEVGDYSAYKRYTRVCRIFKEVKEGKYVP